MDLSPTLRFSSRSQRSREEGDFSLGQMNWLLGSRTTTRTSFTSLYSYGSNGNNHNLNSNSSDERLNSRRRSSSLKFVEPSIEIQSAAEQPIDVLSQSIKSCIENVFGLYGIEVWRFDDETGKLFNVAISQQSVESGRSECGMHIKRIPQEADHESPSYSPEARDAFERLAYTSRIDYLAPEPVESGCSLAGALWSETPTSNFLEAFSNRVSSIGYTIHKRAGFLAGLQPIQSADESISWRDVGELVKDPNQPYDARLQLLSKAGFKLAAGIPVDIPGFRGIIIFFANPYSDRRKLCLDNNAQLILRSACYIAAAAALLVPMKIASDIKNNQSIENWRRLRLKILAIVRFQKPLLVRRSRVTSNLRTGKGSFVLTLERMKSMTREKSFKILSNAATESRRKIATAMVDIQHAAKARCMKWLTKLKGGNAR
ncbi:hypothetical protein HJC23_002536 [Cyclotella cryptica]|uniref:GAF domain-containing protein n=1 Tax=Cyclotella cryptica TaxID=29204 RepID=A0ABD3QW42_9STRA|eukprot:CCRYP_001390-RB/>CCRYP_001390-RB protein AED:0.03 eAED:0.03 QI:162/1/1/1/1/0.75/4/1182/429